MLAGGARAGNDPNNVPKSSSPDPDHDVLSALDQWVEQGIPPYRIVATRHVPGASDRSMPVCAYPFTAQVIKDRNTGDLTGFRCPDQKETRRNQ